MSRESPRSYQGKRYVVGVASGHYVIARREDDAEVARYPRTGDGWASAWKRFSFLELRDDLRTFITSSHPMAIVVHVIIGGFLGFVLVMGLGLAIVDSTVGIGDTPLWLAFSPLPGAALVLPVMAGIFGWATIVYWKRSRAARAVAAALIFLAGMTFLVITGFIYAPSQP